MLAHDRITAPTPGDGTLGILFLHGILGSRGNWRGFARRLLERDPRWVILTADLRNHGESHDLPPPDDLEHCAQDVQALAEAQGFRAWVLVGHSFGGKVALQTATHAHRGLTSVWSLDSPPGRRSFDGASVSEEVENVLRAVRRVTFPLATRQALVAQLRAQGLSERLAQWMTTNLRTGDQGLEWKFDLDRIPAMLQSFGETDLWPFIQEHRGDPGLVLVRGGRSDRWAEAEYASLERATTEGELTTHVMPEAGHWLHTDDPEGLLALLEPTLAAITTPG